MKQLAQITNVTFQIINGQERAFGTCVLHPNAGKDASEVPGMVFGFKLGDPIVTSIVISKSECSFETLNTIYQII